MFVHYKFSPILHLLYAEFGLLYREVNTHFELCHSGWCYLLAKPTCLPVSQTSLSDSCMVLACCGLCRDSYAYFFIDGRGKHNEPGCRGNKRGRWTYREGILRVV